MNLKSFSVANYRSIGNSGPINISSITALVGRNESGKSNLLRALHSLNPAEGFAALNPVKDFPRNRRLEECADDTPVVSSSWELNKSDIAELSKILSRAAQITAVTITRGYGKDTREVFLEGLSDTEFKESEIKGKVHKIVPAVHAAADKLSDAQHATRLQQTADSFETRITIVEDRLQWARNAEQAIKELRKGLAAVDAELTDKQEQILEDLENLATDITHNDSAVDSAKEWVLRCMPVFIFLEEYPELDGHQDIQRYIARKNNPTNDEKLNQADRNFEKMCKVAGLKPAELHDLLSKNDPEKRNQLVNRASAIVTAELRRLWKDRPLKIRFNLDAHHLDTFVSDPNSAYDVEVNLAERSRGFQWFFSFYITFSADTNGGHAENAILLLDEPGLYLHAKSQADLLQHFKADFKNQIIYTTHSPFMVPTASLDSIRTVSITEEGTLVNNSPVGDSKTLFPIQAALGYDLSQSLFVGQNNLVIEGVTDFWILSSVSEYFADRGMICLNKAITLTPAGGAPKVPFMVALLSSQELNVLILLDKEKEGESTKAGLLKSKLMREENIIFASEAFGENKNTEADIEDLFEPEVYEDLVRESYAVELKGKTLKPNKQIPRIAKRIDVALNDLGIAFQKTRPTRLFLKKMATTPEKYITTECAKRFETLFSTINQRFDKHLARKSKAFT